MLGGRIAVRLVDPFANEREMFGDYLLAVGIRVIATDSIEAARREVAQDSTGCCRSSRMVGPTVF